MSSHKRDFSPGAKGTAKFFARKGYRMHISCHSIAARVSVALMAIAMASGALFAATLRLTDAQLIDRITGGWLAKTAGGALGGPAEGAGLDTSRGLPPLDAGTITDCENDDVYVQVPFIATMSSKMKGANGIYAATMADYGATFGNTSYDLWWGNDGARKALNAGIAPPYTGGQPLPNGDMWNYASDAIDWQIECQWIGIVTPGLPATCKKIDSICGHVIGYAEGIYSGTFFDVAMSIAPLFTDIHPLIKEARKALPLQSECRKIIDTLIWYHDNNPTKTYIDANDWAFGLNGQTKHIITDHPVGSRNNLAIVAIAALWCDNSITKAILWAVRLGQDTDCNCGDVAGILGSMLGYSGLPQQWRTTYEAAMAQGGACVFSGTGLSTNWTFKTCLDSTISIAKKVILQSGGTYANGVYTIPVQDFPAICAFEKIDQQPVSITPCIPATPVVVSGTPIEVGIVPAVPSDRLILKIVSNAGNGLSIRFAVPPEAEGKTMSIDLLDLKGRLVATLVKGMFGVGYHAVNIASLCNGAQLHGRYLARIKAVDFEKTAIVTPAM